MGLLKKIFASLNTTNSVPQNTTPLTNYGSAYKATLEELDKTLADSDKALNEMWKADGQYEKDGDISKRILVYEKHLKQKPKWNNFNQCLSLANMYEKAGRNNDAWGYLNQLYIWSIDPTVPGGNVSKVRFEQFRILKGEKKYADAMVMLVSGYLVNAYEIKGIYFNKEKFIKDAKTTAKKLGKDEEALKHFADDFEKKLKSKQIQERDVKQFCTDYFLKQ